MAGWFSKARRALSRLVARQARYVPDKGFQRPRPITPSVPFERSWPEKITAGWLASTDPNVMLSNLPDDASPRKLRLFAAGCCRPLVNLIERDWCRGGVNLAERLADGGASEEEVRKVREEALRVTSSVLGELEEDEYDEDLLIQAEYQTANAIALLLGDERLTKEIAQFTAEALTNLVRAGVLPAGGRRGLNQNVASDPYGRARRQSALLRDIFGNPFLPLNIDPLWLACNDGAAVDLARGIYEEGHFDDMPILADALEDAGCANTDILWHCRHIKDHARGCWVVDAILGKK